MEKKNKVKRILVFLLDRVVERDYDRFGFPLLKEQGFHVEFWSFANQFIPDHAGDSQTSNKQSFYRNFQSKNEAREAIHSLNEETVVVLGMPCTLFTFWIYRALTRSRASYGIANPNAMPFIAQNRKSLLRLFLHPFSTARKIILKLISMIPFERLFIRPIDFALVGGNQALMHYQKVLGLETSVIKAHSLDYDLFLYDKGNRKEALYKTKYAVFMDQYLPYHPDNFILGRKNPFNPYEYYGELNKFFSQVERETGVRVVIAAHPRADYSDKPFCYPNRDIVYGHLGALVRDCEFILGHHSTGVSFANIYKKSVVFIYNEAMVKENFSHRATLDMAYRFGKKAYEMNKETIDWKNEIFIDADKYAFYREQFIKMKGSEEKNTWLIFSEFLRGKNTNANESI